jgi:NTP pyrophosphatase (non-canonical NTP hydrolase)
MANLPNKPILSDYQHYVKQICEERGWVKNSYSELFLLFTEEVGELAKAMRNAKNLFSEVAKADAQPALKEEFADVFSYLLDLANLFEIDLEKAFRDKEKVNANRSWKQ